MGRQDCYAFAHALIGQVLYDELPRHRLRRLHLRAGEALERARGGRAETAADLARHFLLAGETTKAARYAMAAGDRAAELFAHDEALGHYEAAADLLEELGDRAGAAAARRKLGMALHHLNRMDEALPTFATAHAAFEQLDDRARQATVEYEIGAVRRHKYDFTTASAHYAAALRLWPEGHDPVGRAFLLLYAGLAATLGGRQRGGEPTGEAGAGPGGSAA